MDVIDHLQIMNTRNGWKWEMKSSDIKGADIVIRARLWPYGRMYGYGGTAHAALTMMKNMVKERTEELVTNEVFCHKCRGEGQLVGAMEHTCEHCNGTGMEPKKDDLQQTRREEHEAQAQGEGNNQSDVEHGI